MNVAGVDLPTQVVSAHANSNLVLFVGAGASMGAGLPDYDGLAAQLADDFGVPMTGEAPDDFLTGLQDREDIDVHRRAMQIIGDPAVQPSALHRALVSLATAAPAPRIITTNYDDLLSQSAANLGADLELFSAPALPLGHDFDGIVHLHGSVRKPPHRSVVTSRDFGAAYLTDAWASRFLDRVFREYTVVFIGYSLKDVIVRYLTQAVDLGVGPGRFALLTPSERANAHRLGITPILFSPDDEYAQLTECIQDWADEAGGSLTDRVQRIVAIADAGPPSGADAQHVEFALADPVRLANLCDRASGQAWLQWMWQQPAFMDAMTNGRSDDVIARTMTSWFATTYAVDPEASEYALSLVRTLGSMSPALVNAIGWAVNRLDDEDVGEWVHPWLARLLRDEVGTDPDWLTLILEKLHAEQDAPIFWPMLQRLLTPVANHGDTYKRVRLRGDGHYLDMVWESVAAAAEGRPAETFEMAVGCIERWEDLERAVGGSSPLTVRRSAIEPHEQDAHPDPIDRVIDLARDAAEKLCVNASVTWHIAKRSTASRATVARRLGLHLLARSNGLVADEVLTHLVEIGAIEDLALHHEYFRCLAAWSSSASEDVIDEVVSIVATDTDSAHDASAYHQWMTLTWMRDHGADSDALRDRIGVLEVDNPDWQQREHPDLQTWMSDAEWVNPTRHWDVEAERHRIEQDPSAVPAWIDSHETSESPSRSDTPSVADAMALLRSTVAESPWLGLRIWDASPVGHRSRLTVLSGWRNAEVDADLAEAILERIGSEWSNAAVREEASWLFGGRSSSSWYEHPAVSALLHGREVDLVGPRRPPEHDSDALTWAVNTTAGRLFEVLVLATNHANFHGTERDRDAGVDRIRSTIAVAERDSAALHLAARWLDVIAELSPDAASRVCHMALAEDVQQSSFGHWASHLSRLRCNDALVQLGYVDMLLDAWTEIPATDDLTERMASLIAAIALHDPGGPDLLLKAAATDDRSKREQLHEGLGRSLPSDLDDAGRTRWWPVVSDYLQTRLTGVPRTLRDAEVAAIDEVLPRLEPDAFDSAVELLAGLSRRREGRPHVLYELAQRMDEGPGLPSRAVGYFLRDVLSGLEPPVYTLRELDDIVATASAGWPSDVRDQIRSHALRLGHSRALDW